MDANGPAGWHDFCSHFKDMEAASTAEKRKKNKDTVTSVTITEVLSELGKLSPDRALNMYEAVLRDARVMPIKVLLDLIANLTVLHHLQPRRVSSLLKMLANHPDAKVAMAGRLALIQNVSEDPSIST
jgi:hypothetical protein